MYWSLYSCALCAFRRPLQDQFCAKREIARTVRESVHSCLENIQLNFSFPVHCPGLAHKSPVYVLYDKVLQLQKYSRSFTFFVDEKSKNSLFFARGPGKWLLLLWYDVNLTIFGECPSHSHTLQIFYCGKLLVSLVRHSHHQLWWEGAMKEVWMKWMCGRVQRWSTVFFIMLAGEKREDFSNFDFDFDFCLP